MNRDEALISAIRAHDGRRVKTLLVEGANANATTPVVWTKRLRLPMSDAWHLFWFRLRVDRGIARGTLDANMLKEPWFVHPIPAIVLTVTEDMPEDTAVDIIESLLDHGASINMADGIGNTALLDAANRGRVKIIDTLLQRGANIGWRNESGHHPLGLSVRSGNLAAVKRILESGPNINAQDGFGNTALMAACYSKSDYPIARLLLESGANVHLKNSADWDALDTARSRGCDETVRLLVSYSPSGSESSDGPAAL